MTEDEKVLLGTLLWLRNHYDVRSGLSTKGVRARVLKNVDLVLEHYGVGVEASTLAREFRERLEGEGAGAAAEVKG